MSERNDALEEAARLIEADALEIIEPAVRQLLMSQAAGIRLLKSEPQPPTINEILSTPRGIL